MKNGIASRTKWLTPCHITVGSVVSGIGMGLRKMPTKVDTPSVIATGTRRMNSATKTAKTMASGGTAYSSPATAP